MELLLKIWNWLTESFAPIEAALVFGAVLILWAFYRHILARIFDTYGEWCEGKLRKRLSLPSKTTPHHK